MRTALSVSLATGLYGVSFGALSVAAGLDLAQTMALSLLMFSGGSQFAAVGVLGAGGGVGAAVATAGLLGVRNGLYGVQVAPLLGTRGWRRLLAAHLTIGESTAVATAQPGPASTRAGFWWTGAGVFVLWNAFTLLGALLGDALGDPGATASTRPPSRRSSPCSGRVSPGPAPGPCGWWPSRRRRLRSR